MNMPVPRHTCQTCGEFLPHSCAAVVEFSRRIGNIPGRRIVSITDRQPEPERAAVVLIERPGKQAIVFIPEQEAEAG